MKKYSLEYFTKTKWSLVLVKNGKITYRSKKEGLQPLLFCLKNKKNYLRGAGVCDKIIGRAAALLMVYGEVKNVMTPVVSRTALAVFRKNKIPVEYRKITKCIMNKTGNDLCPMEKLSKNKTARQLAELLLKK